MVHIFALNCCCTDVGVSDWLKILKDPIIGLKTSTKRGREWPLLNVFWISATSSQLTFFSLFVSLAFSVTRLGDLWDFGQVFKAFGNRV